MEKRTLIILLICLIVLFLGVAGSGYYYVGKINQEKEKLQKEVDDLKKQLNDQDKSSQKSSDKSNSSCASTLTDDDRLMSDDWKTYTNDRYNYSFKYPKTWQIDSQENNLVSLSDDSEGFSINFQFRSGAMTEIGVDSSYTKTYTTQDTVACVEANKSYYSSDDNYLIHVVFSKDDTPHLLMMTYGADVGASISSDIGEQFDLLLKTIAFS